MPTQTTKRNRLTLLLGGVFLCLIGIIGWMEFGNQPAQVASTDSIDNITIKRAGHPDIVLVKSNQQWRMRAPFDLRGNAQRIDPLLSLGVANFDGYEQSEVDMAATGLNAHKASISIGEREILLGNPDNTDERRYALIDNTVSFVPSWVWSLVHGGVTAFSDLTVFTALPNEVYLQTDGATTKLINLASWTTLQADKVTAWPNELTTQNASEKTDVSNDIGKHWTLMTSPDKAKAQHLATVVKMQDHTLIRVHLADTSQSRTDASSPKSGPFAYVISNARFDALLN